MYKTTSFPSVSSYETHCGEDMLQQAVDGSPLDTELI